MNAQNLQNRGIKIFIHISASSVNGLIANVDENVLTKLLSFYGNTKLAAKQLVLGL